MQPRTIPTELLKRYDIPGPRYTSYPTANRFTESFTEADYLGALDMRAAGVVAAAPLSLYVHIPFCESLCYYCGCNKIVTKHHELARPYLDKLYLEMELVATRLGGRQRVSQLHFGGGSPTFLSNEELAEVMERLRQYFELTSNIESSIEVDPRTVSSQRLKQLWDIGFNRLSFGVQDFDENVQKAVHREQSTETVFELVDSARSIGFESISVDLIYGLPLQTLQTFARTLDKVAALRPDRLSVYSYAHLPHLFKPQRRILAEELPDAATRLSLLGMSIERLQELGYEYIGMDHFALPQDSLTLARKQGRMQRNFQGYSTHADCDIIGLGVSSISKVGSVYSQNCKDVQAYSESLDRGHLPVMKGITLNRDDLLRRSVIIAIMCQGEILYESFELAFLIDFNQYFAREIANLEPFIEQGFIEMDAESIKVTTLGWFFVRALAMTFDKYLQLPQEQPRFSRII